MKKIMILFIFMMILYAFPSLALSVSVHVPEKYTNVIAGERLYFDVSIRYPENPQRKDLRLQYEIVNGEGDIIAQSKVLKAIETQASFLEYIVIPEHVTTGMYTIRIGISDYEDLNESVETSFHIQRSRNEYAIIIFFGSIISGLLIGLLWSLYDLKKMINNEKKR